MVNLSDYKSTPRTSCSHPFQVLHLMGSRQCGVIMVSNKIWDAYGIHTCLLGKNTHDLEVYLKLLNQYFHVNNRSNNDMRWERGCLWQSNTKLSPDSAAHLSSTEHFTVFQLVSACLILWSATVSVQANLSLSFPADFHDKKLKHPPVCCLHISGKHS